MYIYIYVHIYMYIHDVRVHTAGTNVLKSAQKVKKGT